MIGHWPSETFGGPVYRLTLRRRITRLMTSIRSDSSAVAPPADRRPLTPSLADRDVCHQFQYRNLSDDPYQSLELDDILESPQRS
jgi:hypothetical protein